MLTGERKRRIALTGRNFADHFPLVVPAALVDGLAVGDRDGHR